MRAIITGTGLLTPLGLSPHETWASLLAGGSIHTHSLIPLPPPTDHTPRVNQLALHAAHQAITAAGWTPADLASNDTALVVGTSKGAIESWSTPSPLLCEGLSSTATSLAKAHAFGMGPRLTLSAACATGLHALIRATLLIESRQATKVLIVAAESSLSPLFVGSFNRLGVLSSDQTCRPFDTHRTGFLLSEGAAAVCLESPFSRSPLGCVPPPIEIESYALGADATHLTASDPTAQTLRHLLTQFLNHRPVDFIHAHGTATQLNDLTELTALESTLTHPTPLYSHKAALGHSLGSAGLISVVLNCLAHSTATIPPNINTNSPLPTRLLRIENKTLHLPNIRRSLVMAAGFGGAIGIVSLISPPS